MKLTTPDRASMALGALCIVGIVVLSVLGIAIPDALNGATYIVLGIGGGTALNGPKGVDARVAATLANVEQLLAGFRTRAGASAGVPASRPAPVEPAGVAR